MTEQAPSVGSIVHYVQILVGTHILADVQAVNDDGTVTLLLRPWETYDACVVNHVRFDATGKTGHSWHWPE